MSNERDRLADALVPHGPEIREAYEWRPLADHVLALLRDAAERAYMVGVLVEAARNTGEPLDALPPDFPLLAPPATEEPNR